MVHYPHRLGVAVFLGLLLAVGLSCAQAQHKRLIHRFDFEEAAFGNFETMPNFWHRIGQSPDHGKPHFTRQPLHQKLSQLKGYPSFTQVRFDPPQQVQGNHSLYLGLNGYNAGAFLEVGAVPAIPHSDYRITAKVMTHQLEHARVRLTAYFVDGEGKRIESSVTDSGLLVSEGRWQTISLPLNGDFSQAAWLGMQVQLLQSIHKNKNTLLGEHEVLFNEVDGGVWLDDIAIWQLPNISVTTQSPVNIIRQPNHPKLSVKVRDLTGRQLVSELTIYDHQRNKIAQRAQRVGAGAPTTWHWEPTLPQMGWYLVDLSVMETESDNGSAINLPISRTLSSFLWLPDEWTANLEDARLFGIRAEGLPPKPMTLLPMLMEQARLHGVVLSAWGKDTTLQNLESQQTAMDKVLLKLLTSQREVTFSLNPVPTSLGHQRHSGELTPLTLFEQDDAKWMPLLRPILLRHSQRIQRWQLGSTETPEGFFLKNATSVLSQAKQRFESWIPKPLLLLPWSALEPHRPSIGQSVGYVLKVPYGIRPQHLTDFLQEWKDTNYTLDWHEPPATELAHHRRITDLVLRMLHAWELKPANQTLTTPWAMSNRRHLALLPDPLLGAFVGVSQRLAGRRATERLDLGEGLSCIVFDGDSDGMLALWNRSAPQNKVDQHLYLGSSQPQQIDIWGNRKILPLENNRHHFTLNHEPIFIEGIDLNLARFRASFRVDEPFIESRQTPHERTLHLKNPWPRTISGHITITGPPRWRIEPKRTFFSIAAGQPYEIPIKLAFAVAETAGPKILTAKLTFNTTEAYQVQFHTPLELGLKNIDFQSHLMIRENSKTGKLDAVITQMIANKGTQTLSLYAFANMAGFSRQERLISRLQPGQRVVKQFRFPDGAKNLVTGKVRTGLRETNGPAILNHVLSAKNLTGG